MESIPISVIQKLIQGSLFALTFQNLIRLYKEKNGLSDINETSCKFEFKNRKSLEEHLVNFFYLLSLEQIIVKSCEEMKLAYKLNYPDLMIEISTEVSLKFTFEKCDDLTKMAPFKFIIETNQEMLKILFRAMRRNKFDYDIFKKIMFVSIILYESKSSIFFYKSPRKQY